MSTITPLICTACGSQLKPTSEQDRFTCPNCGTEHLVDRNAQPAAAMPTPAVTPGAAGSAKPAPGGRRSAAGALIELFDHIPDAKALDILLEPVNLLKLMLLYGWTEQDIKQQLTNGKIPGELLLELLEREPDPNKLLAQLGKPAIPAQAKTSSMPSTAPEFSARVAGSIFVVFGALFAIGALLSFWWLPGEVYKFQIVLLCAAPVLILIGIFQILTNRKIMK
jgi:hypothetical protein